VEAEEEEAMSIDLAREHEKQLFGYLNQHGRRKSVAPLLERMPETFQLGFCAALCSLEPREQFVFRTVYLFGFTASHVARMVGVSREVIARLLRQVDRKLGKKPYDINHTAWPELAWKTFLPGAKPWGRKKP
jgi:DNA-directed RNA polymerase specialized sigma24 family protein